MYSCLCFTAAMPDGRLQVAMCAQTRLQVRAHEQYIGVY